MLTSPVPPEAIVSMRLDALVVDLAVLGPQGWAYLDVLCARRSGDHAPVRPVANGERASPGWRYIHTHFGIGYRFEAEPPDSVAASSVREAMPSLR